VTIVRVCVGSDRRISSTDIIESSGDVRFDSLALDWARSIRLRAAPPAGGAAIEPCGQVRVELKAPTERGLARSDTSLG
jgi:outer membrane biosynthesis protein TonB